jgi:hypothetical protein
MSLSRLYKISEAGTLGGQTKEPRKKRYSFKHANGGAVGSDDEDDLGPDLDYDDPSPPELPQKTAVPATPPPEPERPTPFASKSAAPSKALQGGKTANSVKADVKTLEALQNALESVRTKDEDLQDWIDDVIREIGRAVRSGGDLTLPKFEATPDLDDFNDDAGSEDEDY